MKNPSLPFPKGIQGITIPEDIPAFGGGTGIKKPDQFDREFLIRICADLINSVCQELILPIQSDFGQIFRFDE